MANNRILILASLLLIIGLFGWQSAIELRAEEPRRAIVSIEMFLTGEYIVPHINGWSYYNKPPVFNWVMAACFWLFGSMSEWVVRLPSLLSLVTLATVHYFFSRRYLSQKVALLSAFFYLTAAEVLLYGAVNSGEIDPFYALLAYLQVMVLFHFHQRRRWYAMFLISYFFVALGFLVKGLPSIAFQGLTLVGMAVYHRQWKILFHPAHFAGLGFFLLVSAAYFYPYALQDDLPGFLVRQYKEAAMRTGLETSSSDTFWQSLTFPLQMAKLLLPWSLLAVFMFQKKFRSKLRNNPLLAFSALFIVVNIPVYWISGDFKPRYYYMFFPFILLLLSWFYQDAAERMGWARKLTHSLLAVMACLLPLGFIILLFIPAMTVVPDLSMRVFAMSALGLLAAVIFFRAKSKLIAMVLVMAVARLGLNLFYMPAWQADKNVAYARQRVSEILQITGDEKVYLYGEPYVFSSDASLGPLTFEKVELTTAPIISYRIPYYLSRSNRQVMTFTEELKAGEYHLAPADMIDSSRFEVLYRIDDPWQKKEYLLIRP